MNELEELETDPIDAMITTLQACADKLRRTAEELRTPEEKGGINRHHAAARLTKLANSIAPERL